MTNYWLITTEFPPLSGGGISTYCRETVRMLEQHHVVSTVFIPNNMVKSSTITNHSWGKLIEISTANHVLKEVLGYDALVSYIIAEYIEEYLTSSETPNFIETQDYLGIGYYLLQKKKNLTNKTLTNIPIVITLHAPDFLYQEFNQTPRFKLPTFWTGEMEKWCVNAADKVISPSQHLIDVLKSKMDFYDIKAKHIFNPFEDQSSISTVFNKNEIVFFGKLTPQKGAIEMFEYLSQMWGEGFEFPIRVIGGGNHFFHPKAMDLVDWLKKKHKTHFEAGKIIFEGHIDPKEINERLSTPHVIIVPSIVDNLPYAVIEAMNNGKIVLGSDCSGHKELIENSVSGFIFKHEFTSFESKLNAILNLTDDQIIYISNQARSLIQDKLNYSKIYTEKQIFLGLKSTKKQNYPFTRNLENKNISIDESQNLLSIVIPYYNLSEYIGETLKSIFSNEYKDIEVIIVNDGSDPENSKILAELSRTYTIKIISQSNQGLATSRNVGAKKAVGKYLAFLDADDTIEKTYYTKAIRILKSYHNVSFVGCWAQYFGESSIVWPTFIPEPPFFTVHNSINSSALVYKKEAFMESGQNDSNMLYGMEDYESVLNMISKGYRGMTISEPLWNYRIRKNSMAQAFNTSSELYLYDTFIKKHSDFLSRYTHDSLMLLHSNGSGLDFDNPTKEIDNGKLLKFLKNHRMVSFVKSNKVLRKFGTRFYSILNK